MSPRPAARMRQSQLHDEVLQLQFSVAWPPPWNFQKCLSDSLRVLGAAHLEEVDVHVIQSDDATAAKLLCSKSARISLGKPYILRGNTI